MPASRKARGKRNPEAEKNGPVPYIDTLTSMSVKEF